MKDTGRKFRELFGGLPGDARDIAQIARRAAVDGYAVLPIKPGSKQPICMLTELQARRADKKVSAEAKLAGRRGWERVRHPCGIAHASNDPKVVNRVFKRLERDEPDINLAVSLYPSRALVVDCDTAAELASFTTLWAKKEEVDDLQFAAPTVRSPGERGEDGEWKHSEGGHYWFLLPEDVELGELAGTTSIPIGTDSEHPAQLKVAGYVLVPPSVRAEGAYVMASDVHEAPDWLVELVRAYLSGRRETIERRRDAALDDDDELTLAQSLMPWSDVLAPRGWQLWYKTDRCGCEIWTAPGEHANPKSATAHDPGCGLRDSADGWLHVWTDNQPGGMSESGMKDYSKIQVVAWSDHLGDQRAAMVELGMMRPGLTVLDDDGNRVDDDEDEIDRLNEKYSGSDAAEMAAAGDEDESEEDEEEDEEDEEEDPVEALLAELIPADQLHTIPRPEPLVDGLLDLNTVARVIGKSGHGKSFFMIDMAGHVALGKPWHGRPAAQGDVVYMVAEGAGGIRKRVAAWEQHHGVDLGAAVKFLPRPVQALSGEWLIWVAAMERLRPKLIVIDTQARVTAGANENGPEEMGLLVQRAELLVKRTGACVVLVHHKGHQGDHGRGHSSVIAAMDAEIEVEKEGKNKIMILSSKQKDREDFDPITLLLSKVEVDIDDIEEDSAVLVALDSINAPADDGPEFDPTKIKPPTFGEEMREPEQISALLWHVFREGRGALKSEIKSLAMEHCRGRDGHKISKRTFYRSWSILEGRFDPQGDPVLEVNGTRFRLSIPEAERLGLTSAD